jgi:hypothetical protein
MSALTDMLPVAAGYGLGTVDGLVESLDQKRDATANPAPSGALATREYQTLFRGGLFMAGIVAALMHTRPVVYETMLASSTALLASELVQAA